jgi:hypothetical protein
MDSKIILFEESPMLGGYSLAVRDDWVYKIKRVHITEKEKVLYEKRFGDAIITYSEFYEWWCDINQFGQSVK